MGRKLNLGHLTEEECEQILKVIQKDFDIRQVEKERLACIEAKVQEEDARMKILATRQDFNEKYCLICFKKFLLFFTPKTRCSFCKYYLCKNCISFDSQLKSDICLVCRKYHEYLQQSNSWFYKKIGSKFKRFGSAKVVRSLYKRKTDSDAESDSGYHPSVRENVCLSESMAKHLRPNLSKVFEMDEMKDNADEDDPVRTMSYFRHKLEAIERQIRKQFIENKGGQQSGRSSGSSDELMKQQEFNISLLLSSMTNELTSHLNDTAHKSGQSQFHETEPGDNATKEAISKCVLEQCISHIYESSLPANVSDDDHPFGIDPDDQTLRNYIKRLSTAIVTKITVDLQSSEEKIFQEEEEEVRKELLKLSNRARMSQIGKQLSDSELEDLQVTTDSMSDVDVREWPIRNQTDTVSTSSSLRRGPVDQSNFDESEYDVSEDSIFAFASRKKGLVTLPGLDMSTRAKSVDVDLELTVGAGSLSEDPWTLAERGPVAMMSSRIPIAPYDNYGKKKCGPAEAEGDLKIFLPKRPSVEGPMIDSMNVYELSDLSDGSLGSPFEESHVPHEISIMEQLPLGQPNRPRSQVEHVAVSADRTPEEDMEVPVDKTPLEHLDVPSHVTCGNPNKHADIPADSNECLSEPWFVTVPEDVAVNCGETFTCSCKLSGAKPIDVFWYRDADELIQLGSDERFTLMCKGSTYKIRLSNCQSCDSGLYLCIAVNQHGSCQHRFTVKVQDAKIHEENLLDSCTTGSVALQTKDGLEIGLPPYVIRGLKSDGTSHSERPSLERIEGEGREDGKDLTADLSSTANWRKELLTKTSDDIPSYHQGSEQQTKTEHLLGSQGVNSKSASADKATLFHMESSDNSSTADGDKATVSGVALDVSSRANGNKATAANSIRENEEAIVTEEKNENLVLHSSQKKSMKDGIGAAFTRGQHETMDDENTVLTRDDTTGTKLLQQSHPNEIEVRNTCDGDFVVTGVRDLTRSDTDESSLSCKDHQKSNEGEIKTAMSDEITENNNRIPTKANAELQLSYGGSKRSNIDNIRTSGMVLTQTDSVEKRQVKDSTTGHHLTYRNHDKLEEPNIRTSCARFSDEPIYEEGKTLIKDEISQYLMFGDHKTSAETEIRTDTETMNRKRVSPEKTLLRSDTREYPTFHDEVSGKYENLSSAKHITSRITSADSEIKEKSVEPEINLKDTRTNEVQIPTVVDCSPPNVDYRQYSRDFDISTRRQLFEQASAKPAIMERRISASSSHLSKSRQYSSSESDIFEPEEKSCVKAASINLGSPPKEPAQAPQKNDLDELTLPSVKLLRLKFSKLSETSSAEALLQRKRHSESKLEAEPRWKSSEHAEKQFASSQVPVSVIPLQPAPINSRSTSRPLSHSDNTKKTSHLKLEPKFQREVIIRPNVTKYNQTNSEEEQPEPDEYLLPDSTTVAERVVIRPFSQRSSPSPIIEDKKKASNEQNR